MILPVYAAGGEYQEIYSGSDFASTRFQPRSTINSIGFASSEPHQRHDAAIYDVTLSLSSTSQQL